VSDDDDEISWLLSTADRDDPQIKERLWAAIYPTLRQMAEREMRNTSRMDESLQPGCLVDEAYMRLAPGSKSGWEGRAHFFGTAASIMRHILVDRARKRRADKRGGQHKRLTLDAAEAVPDQGQVVDVQALDEALRELAKRDARQARIVELRFFGGLDVEETAHVLGISARTVKSEWAEARGFLRKELGAE
jgi:RNA polymerase sigma factor (TIGR02999 family)